MADISSARFQPVFLGGPTAVGKSEIALRLAEQIKGEIISVDSMQVYRGLNIGTAKPSAAERARVPHHLIDVAELTEEFDAAKFVTMAAQAMKNIQSRQRIPIFCGGTGLYFKAFLDGLGDAPPSDAVVRAELEALPVTDLLQELAARDPETFAKIDRQNPRRLVRALEVIRITGKPFSIQRAEWRSQTKAGLPSENFFPGTVIGLRRPVEELHQRISQRVEVMFAAGLIEETRALLKNGLQENRTALQAIGYRQVVEHLRGKRDLLETIELVKIKTRQFAKRQMTWFRRQLNMQWIDLAAGDSLEMATTRVESVVQAQREVG